MQASAALPEGLGVQTTPAASPRALFLARAYYFFFFGAIGCYTYYANLYFEARGLGGGAIGLLAALPPVMLVLGGPLWGALADRFHLHRVLLPLVTLAPIAPIWWVGQTEALGWLAAWVALAAFFSTATGPLIDSAVLELVAGTPHTFGSIRVWGTFGFILASPTMGALLRPGQLAPIFIGYAVCMAAAGLAAVGLPARRQVLHTSYQAGVRQLLAQPAFVLILAAAFLLGAATNSAFAFYPLHLQHLGASTTLIGLAGALAAVTEIPTLLLVHHLLRRFSAWGSLALGAALYVVRWAVVAVIPGPLLATLAQVLHGVSFGPSLVGGVAYVDEHTPPGLSATGQAVFSATQWGLGAAVGAAAGGWVFEHLGAAGFFLAAAAVTAAGLVLILAARRLTAKRPSA